MVDQYHVILINFGELQGELSELWVNLVEPPSILRVCVVKIFKTLEHLSPCFVSNLY